MKKVNFFLAAALILFAAGCASSRKAIVEQKDSIALVSVVSNWDINWKGEEPTNPNAFSLFGGGLLRDDPDMTLVSYADELIATAETLFRAAVDTSPLINLAEKEAVLSSRAYREAKTNEPVRNTQAIPSDYRFVYFRDKNFPAALAAETGIQRVMFVEFDFTKAMYSGFGKNGDGRAELDMNVLILDSRGKTLYNQKISTWSRSTIKVSGGVYSRTGLMELFEEAIGYACEDFLNKLNR